MRARSRPGRAGGPMGGGGAALRARGRGWRGAAAHGSDGGRRRRAPARQRAQARQGAARGARRRRRRARRADQQGRAGGVLRGGEDLHPLPHVDGERHVPGNKALDDHRRRCAQGDQRAGLRRSCAATRGGSGECVLCAFARVLRLARGTAHPPPLATAVVPRCRRHRIARERCSYSCALATSADARPCARS